MTPIDDHPLRHALANELHARPFPVAAMPCTVVFLAIKKLDAAVARDRNEDLATSDQLAGSATVPSILSLTQRITRVRSGAIG